MFKKNNIFYPYLMISILYFLIFIVSPITFIILKETDCHGDIVMGGCNYATFLALLSYFFLTLGYLSKKNISVYRVNNTELSNKRKVLICAFLFWLIGAISCIIYINNTGVSIVDLLFSSSTIENYEVNGSNNIKFLAHFAYFMVFPLTLFFSFSKNRWLVTLILIFTFTLFYLRGTRIFIVIQLLSLILLYVRLNNITIKRKYIIVGTIGILLLFSFMSSNRKSVRSGENIEYKIEVTDILGMLSTNFDIYKPYYGLVEDCPEKYQHTMGKGIFVESIQSLIPRVIWKEKKTDTYMQEAMLKTTGQGPISAAMSWPNIAEYYMDFGILGIILLSYFFGVLLSKSINLYNGSKVDNIILYALLFPTFFQLIIRGYTPINFIMYVCLLLPFFVCKKMNLLTFK